MFGTEIAGTISNRKTRNYNVWHKVFGNGAWRVDCNLLTSDSQKRDEIKDRLTIIMMTHPTINR